MRKTLSISLILVLFLIACQTDKDLKGTWIGEYTSNSKTGKINMVFAEQNLLTFKNNKCFAKGSKYSYGTKIRESNNMTFSNNIIFESQNVDEIPEQYEIVKMENDSLVIKTPNSDFLKIYRKLPNNLKHNQKIDLIGKKFFWKNRMFQDTIYFKTDSTLMRVSIKQQNYKTSSWERINFEGFDILFMDGDVPYLIENQIGKTINLRTFHKTDIGHKMIELK
ncbi:MULTISPECIES: hypothetical protein [Mesonia]|uniref:hypothetical protein n=1 Tax=Mesonia TaxID=232115 RepID=UPI0012409773|nr:MULTISPECIES: hypothetical protein [Mesonia]